MLISSFSRETLIKDVLARHSANINGQETQNFLHTVMRIPKLWITEAQALKARADRDYKTEADLLVSAGLKAEAHRTFLYNLGPQAVISGALSEYVQLYKDLSEAEGHIEGWETGMRMYREAMSLIGVNKSQSGGTSSRQLHDAAVYLAKALPGMHIATLDQRIANVELAVLCNQYLMKYSEYDLLVTLGKKDTASSVNAINARSTEYFRTLTARVGAVKVKV